jgi:hypothetical protein
VNTTVRLPFRNTRASIGPRPGDQGHQARLLSGLGLPGDRHVVLGDARRLGGRPAVLVVRHVRRNLGLQPADPDLVAEVQERMVEFRHHDADLRPPAPSRPAEKAPGIAAAVCGG